MAASRQYWNHLEISNQSVAYFFGIKTQPCCHHYLSRFMHSFGIKLKNTQLSVGFADSKIHYPILDGLRGVAALTIALAKSSTMAIWLSGCRLFLPAIRLCHRLRL
jgi:hypothetical protein